MKKPKHPMQPILIEKGVARFSQNNIIVWFFDTGQLDLNRIAVLRQTEQFGFTKDDYSQLMQLLGYSIDGFAELSFVDKKTIKIADEIAGELIK